MGQYLQPNRQKLLVKAFVHPDQFKRYEEYGREIGITHMYCGPFVRSSYNANLFIAS
jgi:lipoyl synthase